MMVERWGLSRASSTSSASARTRRAAAAQDSGAFDAEIAPVTLPDGTVLSADEGIRRDTTLAALGELKTPFKPDGAVTAGSSSQISDGAAALLVTTSEKAGRARA